MISHKDWLPEIICYEVISLLENSHLPLLHHCCTPHTATLWPHWLENCEFVMLMGFSASMQAISQMTGRCLAAIRPPLKSATPKCTSSHCGYLHTLPTYMGTYMPHPLSWYMKVRRITPMKPMDYGESALNSRTVTALLQHRAMPLTLGDITVPWICNIPSNQIWTVLSG